MLSILTAIAVLLVLLSVPYLIAFWTTWHTVFRCMRVEPANTKDVPEHLKPILKAAIAELKPLGFKMVSCHQIEQGAEKDGKQWGVLLQHTSGLAYASLMTQQLVNSSAPLIRIFTTGFEDDTQFITINTHHYGIYSSDPYEITQHMESASSEEQWQKHQQKLEELCQTRQVKKLSVNERLAALAAHEKRGMERLANNKEIVWVTPGESYRMTAWIAAKTLYKVVRKNQQMAAASKNGKAIAPPTTDPQTAAIPLLELEVAEFHRLQEKQKNGMSQRGKNWLLLGTLALFIASYSSMFEPHKLLIFVAVLLLHEGGHVLAMKIFGYRDTMMLFIPFLGALATARKENASLTEKVWISLAGPLPGLVLGIGLAIAFSPAMTDLNGITNWFDTNNLIREASWMLIILNLFNLLPVYPLDGGQVADLLLFSRNPYIGVVFKGIGVLLLALLGLSQPLMFVFALLIAISIPASFRLAKLNVRFRKDLGNLPHDDREGALRFLLTQLQVPPYQSLPFAQKYNLVLGLLDTRQENAAKWHVRASLAGIYLVSLLGGLVGGLYAMMPNWLYVLGSQGSYKEQLQLKIEVANEAIQANPQDEEAYLERGRARFFLEDFEGAIADANQVLQLNPNSSAAYQLRGMVRLRQDDSAGLADQQKAIELAAQEELIQVNETLRQNPKDTEAYLARAGIYYDLKRYQDSIADCNRALLIDSQQVEAVVMRGQAYLAMGKYPEALGNANHALRLDSESGEAYLLRSQAHHKMGDDAGAIADEQKANLLFEAQADAEDSDL